MLGFRTQPVPLYWFNCSVADELTVDGNLPKFYDGIASLYSYRDIVTNCTSLVHFFIMFHKFFVKKHVQCI